MRAELPVATVQQLLLTFLQLNHRVIILEEGVGAECVGEQHLEGATRSQQDLEK